MIAALFAALAALLTVPSPVVTSTPPPAAVSGDFVAERPPPRPATSPRAPEPVPQPPRLRPPAPTEAPRPVRVTAPDGEFDDDLAVLVPETRRPYCPAGRWDGTRCVAVQLPAETAGRAYG